MADVELTKDERTALSVLAFLFFRMGMDDRARRVYEALAELSEPGTGDRRFAKAGVAAVAVESGDGEGALAALREAMATPRSIFSRPARSGCLTEKPKPNRPATSFSTSRDSLRTMAKKPDKRTDNS